MKRAVIVFTRVPIPGQTKTRMMPYFSPEECAKLHENFLKDIAQECEKVNADIFVCYTPKKGKHIWKNYSGKQKNIFPRQGKVWEKGCIRQSNMYWKKGMIPVY